MVTAGREPEASPDRGASDVPPWLIREAATRRPRAYLPLAIVQLSLVALAVLTARVDRRIDALSEEVVNVSNPTRLAVGEIQLALALETAGTRGYLLTGDRSYVARHLDARARRSGAIARLRRLTSGGDPELALLAGALERELVAVDARLDSLFSGQLDRAEYVRGLPAQQSALEEAVRLAERIGVAMTRGSLARVESVRAAQHRTLALSVIIALLAVVAAVLVGRLVLAYRELARRERCARAQSEAARAESERLAESRARLLRGLTHDVKNPLGAAASYLSLMEEGIVEREEAARRARRLLGSALKLIDELLLLARAEAGDVAIRRTRFDLAAVAREAVEDSRALADSKGLALRLELSGMAPPVLSDADRVRQILGNLLSNAIKYTRAGAVEVRVGRPAEGVVDDPDGWAAVSVSDTGPGLSENELGQLFQEFRRLDTSVGTEGSGLGLSISKRFATMLDGDLVVESEVGTGSTFSLLLPLEPVAAPLLTVA